MNYNSHNVSITDNHVDNHVDNSRNHYTNNITFSTSSRTQAEAYSQATNLAKLPFAEGAAYNHRIWDHVDRCLPNTRVELLRNIMESLENPRSPFIFWLNGMAGTGKSTISLTVCGRLAEKNQLGATFFFSRGRGDLGHAGKFFTTIAAQLAQNLPVLKPLISRVIEEQSDIVQRGLSEQWRHLILDPLQRAPAPSQTQPVLIVIDALDECDSKDDVSLILQLLAQAKDLEKIRLRVFVTSRPETPISHGFNRLSAQMHQDFVLHDIPQDIVNVDISSFFQQKLSVVKEVNGLRTPWPDELAIMCLVEKAAGLFIYAATVYRFINAPNCDPEERLSLILNGSTSTSNRPSTKELDHMYTQVLTKAVLEGSDPNNHDELLVRFRRIVGSIVVLSDTMAAKDLAELLQLKPRSVTAALAPLRSVLKIPEVEGEAVRIFHPSFRDFLLDPQRCLKPGLWVDEKERHTDLFRNCLVLMSKKLRQNMCNLQVPGTFVNEISKDDIQKAAISNSDVQYACLYWVYHFQRGNSNPFSDDDDDRIQQFLKNDFLHWLEALSLMKRVSDAVLMMQQLESTLEKNSTGCQDMLYDAKRFIMLYRPIIERSPLQTYYSALLFSPSESLVRKQYFHGIPWIRQEPKVLRQWSPLLQILEGHSERVNTAVFSPDGKLVASASNDKTVRLWNTATGALCGILEGHSWNINAVMFSPDGKLVASTSYDKTVRLWNTATGASCGILKGHSESVNAVVFSPDSKLVASASNDNTVRVWNATTEASCGILEGHSDTVYAVVFSRDGKLVASISKDNTVRLWNVATGASCGVLEGHSDTIYAVVFSLDSKLVASVSEDKTVRLWNATTGALCGIYEDYSGSVNAAVFSPDGKLVALSYIYTVRLWNTVTKALCGIFKGHLLWIEAVVFSPDSKLVACISSDKTVRLWDIATEALRGVFRGHSDSVSAVVFSPDSKLVASASIDKTVRLWNVVTGVSCGVLEDYSRFVNEVIFSTDGKLAAFISFSRIQLWNTVTEASCGILENHLVWANAAVFSPDGKLVAIASDDKTVKLWNVATDTFYEGFRGHSDMVRAVVFSPDGKLVASASIDKTVRLWNIATGACSVFEGHSERVNTVVFSSDGKLVASASNDNTVRVWNATTEASCGVLEGHSGPVCAVVFSSNGKLVASASIDKTVRLWNAATGVSCGVLEGHSDTVRAVVFSLDGKLVASASSDNTVKLWDCNTSRMLENISIAGIQHIRFSIDGTKLFTNMGILPLTYCRIHTNSVPASLTSSFFFDGEWVIWNQKRILWLPPDYRSCFTAGTHSDFAMGSTNGSITFISFDFECISLDTVCKNFCGVVYGS